MGLLWKNMISFSGVIKRLVLLVVKEIALKSPLVVILLANNPVKNSMILRQEEKNMTDVNKLP